MATLIAFNTVENDCFGVMRITAKSGERITFPRPSDLAKPPIWVNSPAFPKATVLRCSNINCTVQYDGEGPAELMIRYGLKKAT